WERTWNINVFKKDSTLFWKRPYQPSGYEDGVITNDGNNFVIVAFWYFDQGNVIKIFNKDSNDYFIKGNEFKISPLYLEKTVSHRLWRKKYTITNNIILIETTDQNKWEIDITNKKLSLVKDYNSIFTSILIISILILFVITLMLYIHTNYKSK